MAACSKGRGAMPGSPKQNTKAACFKLLLHGSRQLPKQQQMARIMLNSVLFYLVL